LNDWKVQLLLKTRKVIQKKSENTVLLALFLVASIKNIIKIISTQKSATNQMTNQMSCC